MGRLIDADKAIFELGASDRDIYCRYHIEEQPTAYDVEAVLSELEVLLDLVNMNQKLAVMQAIDIVKKGGVK